MSSLAQAPLIQKNFHQLLEKLKVINKDLLEAIKLRDPKSVNELLDKRMLISKSTENLSQELKLTDKDLPEESQDLLKYVVKQDQELLVFLEWEVQKLQSNFKQIQRQTQLGI